MTPTVDQLEDLYSDTKTCAKLVGLSYIEDETDGIGRRKHGKGFSYVDSRDQVIADRQLKRRITELVIPPAWHEVWICPDANGHLLATGIDDKGRKQYIYHPKWRTMRDLIKFYRMLIFGKALPDIRQDIERALGRSKLDKPKLIGAMLWLLDNTYIRVGNEQYYEQNESVGLTTLTRQHVIVAGPVATLSFKGKSGKMQQITFEDQRIAKVLEELRKRPGERLFSYREGGTDHMLEPNDINRYLHELTGVTVSAKDFRTWGGTLMAFNHLIEAERSKETTPKPEKVVIEAVDAAADVLGNTRSVARSSYVHPHILAAYGSRNFKHYYDTAARCHKLPGLDKRETELLSFLEQLFEDEFDLLKQA